MKKLFLLLTGITTVLIVGLFLKVADVKAQFTCDCYCVDQTFGLKKIDSTDSLGDKEAVKLCDQVCQKAGIKTGGNVTNCQEKTEASCQDNTACKTGEKCQGGICIKIDCTKIEDCPSNFTCVNSQCLEVAKTKKCTSNDECPKNTLCSFGECEELEATTQFACNNDSDCAKGTQCKGNKCVPSEATGQACETDNNCPTGYKCGQGLQGKICKPSCLTDSDCKEGEKCDTNTGMCRAKACDECTLDEECKGGMCVKKGTDPDKESPFVPAGSATLENPLGKIDLLNLIGKRIIPGLLGIIGAVAVVAIVWGGFGYVISRGNEEEIKTAKSTITYAIIGLLFVLISWIIINTVVATLTK